MTHAGLTTLENPLLGEYQMLDTVPDTSHIRHHVMENGRVRLLPAAEWLMHGWPEIRTLLHEIALYVVPTTELIDFLDDEIGEDKAIEICAGSGYIGKALGIVMTDSYQQQDDKMSVAYYKLMRQPLIRYPKSVIKLEASVAVRRMRPHTVLGCYATHKWRDDTFSGNSKGVDFEDILAHCRKLILVGNKETHKDNPLMALPHREVELDGLITRSCHPELNRVFIWQN